MPSTPPSSPPPPPQQQPPPPPQQTPIPIPIPTPTPPTTIRKFPAPCWTQDETLALIHAYQDKWYSLRRRNLRTADWEAVADEVNRRCPHQSPPKSSAQCRHKMEKLRKRYRAEKQRISSLPFVPNNRFFPPSSWVFFDLMENMEVGPGSGPGGPTGPAPEKEKVGAGMGVSLVAAAAAQNNGGNLNSGGASHPFVKEEKFSKGKDDLGKYFDEILFSMGKNNSNNNNNMNMSSNNLNSMNNSMKFKVKNQNYNQNERYFDDYVNNGERNGGYDHHKSFYGGGYGNSNKRKMGVGGGGEGLMNGVGTASKRAAVKEKERGKDGVVEEMAASIRMLGEGLIRMETMKMEMMQDIERKRMEMELKRNEMMLQSQHTIVNAFLQGLKKHKNLQQQQQQQQHLD